MAKSSGRVIDPKMVGFFVFKPAWVRWWDGVVSDVMMSNLTGQAWTPQINAFATHSHSLQAFHYQCNTASITSQIPNAFGLPLQEVIACKWEWLEQSTRYEIQRSITCWVGGTNKIYVWSMVLIVSARDHGNINDQRLMTRWLQVC